MKKLTFTCFLLIAMINNTFCQETASTSISFNVVPFTLIGLSPETAINFDFNTPPTPGSPIILSNNTTWLNYTSSIDNSSTTKNITAISTLTIPGIALKLTAGAVTTGGGDRGISKGTVTLSGINQTIIEGIKGAFTGVGINNGHQITLTPEVENFSELKNMTRIFTIYYTITNE